MSGGRRLAVAALVCGGLLWAFVSPAAANNGLTGQCNIAVSGTSGPDVLTGSGNNNEYFAAGGGADVVNGNNGMDCVSGGPGSDESLTGDVGNDEVAGDAGADYLFGGANDDLLDGGSGHDFINAGEGNDTILAADGQADYIRCEGGTDTAIIDAQDVFEDAQCETVVNVDSDVTQCATTQIVVLGTDGPDKLKGANPGPPHSARLFGFGGNDKLVDNTNNNGDCLFGGEGNDQLISSAGASGGGLFSGGPGDDTLDLTGHSGPTGHRLSDGLGDDLVKAGAGNDVLFAGAGKDKIRMGAGNNTVYAADGVPDSIRCGAGLDIAIVDQKDTVTSSCETIDFL
jgi:Ca2+-binding RTX toxin-like protein